MLISVLCWSPAQCCSSYTIGKEETRYKLRTLEKVQQTASVTISASYSGYDKNTTGQVAYTANMYFS